MSGGGRLVLEAVRTVAVTRSEGDLQRAAGCGRRGGGLLRFGAAIRGRHLADRAFPAK